MLQIWTLARLGSRDEATTAQYLERVVIEDPTKQKHIRQGAECSESFALEGPRLANAYVRVTCTRNPRFCFQHKSKVAAGYVNRADLTAANFVSSCRVCRV